jgi:hypothetical protein
LYKIVVVKFKTASASLSYGHFLLRVGWGLWVGGMSRLTFNFKRLLNLLEDLARYASGFSFIKPFVLAEPDSA